MSDERLGVKLISAGFDEDVVFGMERTELMTTYAELLASGKLKVSPGAVGGVGYDPEVEKERLAFEKQKWEAETEERRRKEEREDEIRKQEIEERRQSEEKETEERRRREERETEERRRKEEKEDEIRKQEMEEKRREIEEKRQREEREAAERRQCWLNVRLPVCIVLCLSLSFIALSPITHFVRSILFP